jgi:hypothetical protein
MSLYRQAGGRSAGVIAVVLIAGLLIGALTGFLIGKGTASESSLSEQVADARAELAPVAAGLELVPVEYGNSVRDGRVIEPTEYEASQAAVERAKQTLTVAGEDLRIIDPAGYSTALRAVRTLSEAIDARASAARVDTLARAANVRIERLWRFSPA